MSLVKWGSLSAASDQTMEAVAKNSGSKFRVALNSIIQAIVTATLAASPTVVAAAAAAVAGALAVKKCVHLEAGVWVWDGPDSPDATHYLIPDDTGALVARATPFPTPSASAPEMNW